MELYIVLARTVDAWRRCLTGGNPEWESRHHARIEALIKEHMPSGSGFDSGTQIDLAKSSEEKLVFDTAFHHMDENGFYAGWTSHSIAVKPSLGFDFNLKISGRDRNQIKDYMHEVFREALRTEVDEYEALGTEALDLVADVSERLSENLADVVRKGVK